MLLRARRVVLPCQQARPCQNRLPISMRPLSMRVSNLLYDLSDLEKVENVENYTVNGLHPVSLGDTLAGGRYKIIHKLGFGGSSTVWLARDQQHVISQYNLVALKVMSAKLSHMSLEATQEIAIPQRLQAFLSSSSRPPVLDNIHFVEDHFTETGPNGTHLCIVSRFCGPSILSTNEYLAIHYKRRIRGNVARRLVKQAAIVIESMHRAGIVHGDLTTSNILFKLTDDIQTWTDSKLYMALGEPVREEVVTSSGLPAEPHAPRELVEAINGSRFMSSIIRDSIVVTDFGQSFSVNAMPDDYVPATVIHYTPPEVRFDSNICLASDVWMLACAIYEIRAGDSLFDSFLRSDNLVWMQIVGTFGKLPDPWWEKFSTHHLWFDSNGEPRPQDVQAKDGVLIIAQKGTIGEQIQQIWRPDESTEGDGPLTEGRGIRLDDMEVSLLTDLLEKMLRYRPEDRITMAEVIQHPWFDYQ